MPDGTLPSKTELFERFRAARGEPPPGHWRALLTVACASPRLWAALGPYVDFRAGKVDLEAIESLLPELPAAEALLLRIGLHLYQSFGAVDIAQLAQLTDRRLWRVALEAIAEYRSDFDHKTPDDGQLN